MVEPPSELELSHAFTRKMNHLVSTMKAIHKFQVLLAKVRAKKGTVASAPVSPADKSFNPLEEKAKAEEIEELLRRRRNLLSQQDDDADKGHAQDVTDQEPLHLGIGTGARDAFAQDESTPDVVADSPTAVDFNIYDAAYEEAIKRQMEASASKRPKMYLTKFVKHTEHFKKLEHFVEDMSPPALKSELIDAKKTLKDRIGQIRKSDVTDATTQLKDKLDSMRKSDFAEARSLFNDRVDSFQHSAAGGKLADLVSKVTMASPEKLEKMATKNADSHKSA